MKAKPELRSEKSLEVDSSYVRMKFGKLRELLKTAVTRARAELMKLTHRIELTPVIDGKRKYLRAVGQSRLDGVLGLTRDFSTANNSGGRYSAKWRMCVRR